MGELASFAGAFTIFAGALAMCLGALAIFSFMVRGSGGVSMTGFFFFLGMYMKHTVFCVRLLVNFFKNPGKSF